MDMKVVKAFKLTQCTGAYWRGDEKNKMLCRVYGVAFPKASMLEEHLAALEEAKKRDHKIMITDEAINKVPRVQYKEIPETTLQLKKFL